MYKLRQQIQKARSDIIPTHMISSHYHRFGTFTFDSHVSFSFAYTEKMFEPKTEELDRNKKIVHCPANSIEIYFGAEI